MLLALVAAAVPFTACGPGDAPKEQDSPKESAAIDSSESGPTCAAHGAPTELCFICDASLRDTGRLWCREHDRYEDRCWLCHPELEDKDRLWCKEHSLYEDECFLCHPEMLEERSENAGHAAGKEKADATPEPALFCREHGLPEAECGICHPDLLMQPGRRGVKVRLGSPESAAQAGVVVRPPEVRGLEAGVEGFAELTFDQNELARITSLVGGIVRSVDVDLGTRVRRGDLLATLTSESIGEAQGAYIRALAEQELRLKTFERETDLRNQRISSEREFQEAEAAHRLAVAAARQARQRLTVLGFDDAQIDGMAERRAMAGVLELRAPFDGEIVERMAVQGEVIGAADVLFTLANPSVLWAMVSLPESQLSHVRKGQRVELTVESLPGRSFTGTLTWISASVDRRTRMARGRVEVANPEGLLKAQMFARARIFTARSDRAVVVPSSAVQDVTGTAIVFVKEADDLFEARPVTLGAKRDGRIEITGGLDPDEPVVVAGGFALKSQLLVSRLGAGCVHD
jgi:cobalt-zinc-cadmium efflux system membrane fusion protein